MTQVKLLSLISTIKEIVQDQKLTYQELSSLCKIPVSSLKKIFMGRDFNVSQLFALSEALNVDASEILRQRAVQVFSFTDEQELAFMADLDVYRVFILIARRKTIDEIGKQLGSSKQNTNRILQILEKLNLIERHAKDRLKIVPKGSLQMNSYSDLQNFLERKVCGRLMRECFETKKPAPGKRHVGSMRATRPTITSFTTEMNLLNQKFLTQSTRDHRNAATKELIDVTYFMGLSEINTELIPD